MKGNDVTILHLTGWFHNQVDINHVCTVKHYAELVMFFHTNYRWQCT